MKKGFQRVKVDGAVLRDRRRRRRSTRSSSTTSTWWSTASWCGRTSRRGSPNSLRDRRSSSPTAWRWRSSPTGRSPAAETSQERRAKQVAKDHDRADAERLVFSEKFACPVSGFTIPEIEPRLFSFNNPFGACPKCDGLGVEQHIDADLVVPDKERTLRKGAIAPWAKSSSPYYVQTLAALGKHYKLHARHQVEGPAEEDAGRHPLRLRRRRDPLRLRRRHARLRDQEAVRGRHHQSRAALPRDRQRLGARGDRRAISPTCRARPATAIGSSRRRCA